MRVATIDIGTNSVLLLIAEASDGRIEPVVERSTITRLGQDVDRTRSLHPDAVDRTLACLRDYATMLQQHPVDRLAVVATSASRDAKGAEHFVRQAESILGAAPQVISGQREALLTFSGALSGLPIDGPVAVQDVGGGSTEIVVGALQKGHPQVFSAVSIDVGSVRMTERFLRSDPPTQEQMDAVRAHVREELQRAPKVQAGVQWVGIAGTITTLAAIAIEVAPYDPKRIHGAALSIEQIDRLIERLASMPLEQRRALRGLEPKRADVIVGGALVVREVLASGAAGSMMVSDRGVRWGLALELARAP
ncbi:MAG: Ppx/GppA family phosphatase [Deltaproteobacteria bacterium]|nr:Ppx/GppA family phosphatase [Deltaproteobacteria bacterium]